MNRRRFLQIMAGCTVVSRLTQVTAGSKSPRRPNIVFILADDLGYGDLGCYGQKKIKTPRLDGMARDGIRFTSHYAGFTVCSPSRCALMTGKHMGHASVKGNGGSLKRSDVTVPMLLKKVQGGLLWPKPSQSDLRRHDLAHGPKHRADPRSAGRIEAE